MAEWQEQAYKGCNLPAYVNLLEPSRFAQASLYIITTCPMGVIGHEQFYHLMNHIKLCTLWAAQIA